MEYFDLKKVIISKLSWQIPVVTLVLRQFTDFQFVCEQCRIIWFHRQGKQSQIFPPKMKNGRGYSNVTICAANVARCCWWSCLENGSNTIGSELVDSSC